MDTAAKLQPSRGNVLGSPSTWSAALPFAGLLLLGVAFPLFGGGYWGVIATRACVYWVLVSGLNLVVGFAGQIAIGWVALLTLGAYTTSVLVAGNVTPAFPPYLALAIAATVGANFSGGWSAKCRDTVVQTLGSKARDLAALRGEEPSGAPSCGRPVLRCVRGRASGL